MRRRQARKHNYGVATRLNPRKRMAKASVLREEELLQGILSHLGTVNGQIEAIEEFRDDIASIRMDKEIPLPPLTEDILAVYKDMNARYKELREYILGTLGIFGGEAPEPELDLED